MVTVLVRDIFSVSPCIRLVMTGIAPIVTFEILGVLGVFEVSRQNLPPGLEALQESRRQPGKTAPFPLVPNRILLL